MGFAQSVEIRAGISRTAGSSDELSLLADAGPVFIKAIRNTDSNSGYGAVLHNIPIVLDSSLFKPLPPGTVESPKRPEHRRFVTSMLASIPFLRYQTSDNYADLPKLFDEMWAERAAPQASAANASGGTIVTREVKAPMLNI